MGKSHESCQNHINLILRVMISVLPIGPILVEVPRLKWERNVNSRFCSFINVIDCNPFIKVGKMAELV